MALSEGFHEIHAIGILLLDRDADIIAIFAFGFRTDDEQALVPFADETFVLELLDVRHSVPGLKGVRTEWR